LFVFQKESGGLFHRFSFSIPYGFVNKQLNHSDLFFCTLTALKSLAVALAMPVFFALLAHKITSPALPNLFRNKAYVEELFFRLSE
jgi:hypothetical protein